MNYNDEPIIPIEPEPQAPPPATSRGSASRARRRRAHHLQVPKDAEGQAAFLASLSRRAFPSYELFIYALLCGGILGLGFLLDSQPILIFGILLAPLMTPWVGMLLAVLTGSVRFFFEALMALIISAVLVFIAGITAGFASRPFQPLTFTNAIVHSHLWIPELVVLTVGAVLLTASFVRSEDKPFLPSVLFAYGFYLPISAGAFGLGSGVEGIWPQGVLVFFVHFGLATIFGLTTLFILKFKPSLGGLIFAAILGLIIIVLLVILMLPGLQSASAAQAESLTPTEVIDSQSSLILPSTPTALPTLEPSNSPLIETVTAVPLTLQVTLPATQTPTITLTIEPTPVYAKINASEGGGAFLRKTPNGKFLATLDNGVIVEVLPDMQEESGVPWSHIIATKNGIRIEGWVLQSVLATATPVVNWQPSPTPLSSTTPSFTPTISIPIIEVTPVP